MLTGKTLKALTEVDYLARMKIKFSKEDFKECWDTQGLGPVLVKVVRTTMNSRAQAIRTQVANSFGQRFRVKPKGIELSSFYAVAQSHLENICNPHNQASWNQWETAMRRAYCIPLGHSSSSCNYLQCFTVEQEAFALCGLFWYFGGIRSLTLVRYAAIFFRYTSITTIYTCRNLRVSWLGQPFATG